MLNNTNLRTSADVDTVQDYLESLEEVSCYPSSRPPWNPLTQVYLVSARRSDCCSNTRKKHRHRRSKSRIPKLFACAQTDPLQFLRVAQESKTLCDRYNVPLLINDRIDIALAVNARGVHIGQTDIPLVVARRLLPKDSIIGISCNNVNHVKMAVEDGADYIGIGAVWGTQTKQLTSPLIGVRGVGAMLEILDGTKLKAVAIGRFHVPTYILQAG